jgi:DNA-binding transcriptional ArsR family regulator
MNNVFKALSDPTRRKVLELLRKRPMSAGELGEHFPVSKPTMSAHYAVLREADLIDGTKSGTTITYRIKLSVLEEALLGFSKALGIGVSKDSKAEESTKTVRKGEIS